MSNSDVDALRDPIARAFLALAGVNPETFVGTTTLVLTRPGDTPRNVLVERMPTGKLEAWFVS